MDPTWKPYLVNNELWSPIGGKWLSSHGRLLLRYFKQGIIKIDTKPRHIWRKFPELRLVNPYNNGCNFRKFVSNVRRIVKEESKTMSGSDSDGDSDGDSEYRMPSSDGAPRGHAPDAPSNNDPPIRALLSCRDYECRHQNTAGPVRIYTLDDLRAYIIQIAQLDNLDVTAYSFGTVDGNQKVAIIQYDNPLGTEEDLHQKLTTGMEGVGGEGSFQVNMDPQSYTMERMKKQTIKNLEGNAGSHGVNVPQCYHLLPVLHKIEQAPSNFEIKDANGKLCSYPGMFSCGGCIWIHVKWLEHSHGQVKSRVQKSPTRKTPGTTTPPRNDPTPNSQYGGGYYPRAPNPHHYHVPHAGAWSYAQGHPSPGGYYPQPMYGGHVPPVFSGPPPMAPQGDPQPMYGGPVPPQPVFSGPPPMAPQAPQQQNQGEQPQHPHAFQHQVPRPVFSGPPPMAPQAPQQQNQGEQGQHPHAFQHQVPNFNEYNGYDAGDDVSRMGFSDVSGATSL